MKKYCEPLRDRLQNIKDTQNNTIYRKNNIRLPTLGLEDSIRSPIARLISQLRTSLLNSNLPNPLLLQQCIQALLSCQERQCCSCKKEDCVDEGLSKSCFLGDRVNFQRGHLKRVESKQLFGKMSGAKFEISQLQHLQKGEERKILKALRQKLIEKDKVIGQLHQLVQDLQNGVKIKLEQYKKMQQEWNNKLSILLKDQLKFSNMLQQQKVLRSQIQQKMIILNTQLEDRQKQLLSLWHALEK